MSNILKIGKDNRPELIRKHITIKEAIRSGQPVVKGTRITVADIIEYLGSGMTFDEIVNDFPELNKEQISACCAYASMLLKEDI